MIKFTVTMEKFGCEHSRRVTVMAADPYEAMAVAQLKHRGWQPVDVVAA
jgi:hypothetical protein